MITLAGASYYICAAFAVLLAVSCCMNLKGAMALWKPVPRRYWIYLLGIFAAAFVLRMWVVPHRHYVFYDEYEHFSVARNMLEAKQFSCCGLYLDGKCLAAAAPRWVPGYHFLLSLVLGVFGASESAAYDFNAVLSSITVVIVFLSSFLLLGEAAPALFAAGLLAFLPLHLKFAGNASLETMSLCLMSAHILALMVFIRMRTGRSLFLAVTSLAFATLCRVENAAFFPISLLMARVCGVPLRRYWKFSPLLLLLLPWALYLPDIRGFMLAHYLPLRAGEDVWGLYASGLAYWMQNISVPVLVTVLGVAGIVLAVRNRRIVLLPLLLYFFVFLGIFAFAHKLDVAAGDAQRFNVLLCFPVVMFAAAGAYDLWQWLRKNPWLQWALAAWLLVSLPLNYLECFPYVYKDISGPGLQAQHEAAMRLQKEAGSSAVFVTYEPSIFIAALAASSVNITYLFDQGIFGRYLKGRHLVLFEDSWCREDKGGLCGAARRMCGKP